MKRKGKQKTRSIRPRFFETFIGSADFFCDMLDCVEKNISLFESVLPADAHAHKTRFFRAEKLVAQRRAMQSASYGDSVLLAQNIAYFVAGAVSDSETDYAAGIFQAHDMYVGDFLQAFFYGVCDKLYLRMIVFFRFRSAILSPRPTRVWRAC